MITSIIRYLYAPTHYLQKMWQESQKKAKEFDRVRRTSFKKAQELTAKSPDIPDKILESIPVDKQKEIIRRMTLERKPRRYIHTQGRVTTQFSYKRIRLLAR